MREIASLIVGLLLLLAALISAYDAHTVIEAEEDEEEIGKVLLAADHWYTDIQKVQIELLQFLLTGTEENLVAYESRRYDAPKSLQELRQVLATHFLEALPQLRPLEDLQKAYFTEVDKAVKMRRDGLPAVDLQAIVSEQSRLSEEQIRSFLLGLTDKARSRREAINARVTRSILRGTISFMLMTAIMIAILVVGYRSTTRRLGTIQDLSDRLEQEATHDPLTALPNRRYFNDWISRSASLAARNNGSVGLLLIDLDEFKHVNDRFGHDAGDEVLRVVAQRLQKLSRSSDFAVRFGGDEFAVLIPAAHDHDQLSVVAHRIIAAVAEPVPVAGGTARVGSSIGIAIYPDDAGDSGELVKAADQAMYRAKEEGGNRYSFFGAASARRSAPATQQRTER